MIQFIVITNGAGRVAEVAARFTLDAMPGKQMAIDADLSAGIIDDVQAKRRREEVAQEADFYGAMDGASKFVKGDAIAGLVITTVNLIGGFLIGVVQKGMPIGDAITTYSLLSIGDGLVAQIPALLVSISAGLIVTRSAGAGDLGSDVFGQLGMQRQAVRAAGGVVLLMGLVPGLPKIPFILVGVMLLVVGGRLPMISSDDAPADSTTAESLLPEAPPSPQQMALDARTEPLELDISYDLIELVDESAGGDLLDRVAALRRKLASELGFVMPSIRTRDASYLPSNTYAIKVHGVEVGRGTAPLGRVLVIGESFQGLPGDDVREPVFGLAARWVPAEFRVQAEISGNTVVDRSTLVVTHLAEIVRRRAGRLLGRTDVKNLLDSVRTSDPQVIEDLNTAGVTTIEVQRVLSSLLDDGIPIRDLVRIMEAVSEKARVTRAPEALVEAARMELGPAITSSMAVDGKLTAVTLAPSTETWLLTGLRAADGATQLELLPHETDELIRQLNEVVAETNRRGTSAVLVCSPAMRSALSRLVKATVPTIGVVSYSEIGDHLDIEVIANIDLNATRSPNGGANPEEFHDAFAANR